MDMARTILKINMEACDIPGYMQDPLERYICDRVHPGGFLTAVLSNDLKEAVCRADDTNIRHIADYVRFLFNYAPMACWGSPEDFRNWLKQGDNDNG